MEIVRMCHNCARNIPWFSFGNQREYALLDFPVDGLARTGKVVHLFWTDVSFEFQTVRVTAKPEFGFYPKRWEE